MSMFSKSSMIRSACFSSLGGREDVTAIHFMAADFAAAIPIGESSITMHDFGGRDKVSAAFRNTVGSGFAGSSAPETI